MSGDHLWRLEPHVCRCCLGRVVSRVTVRPAKPRPAPAPPNGVLPGVLGAGAHLPKPAPPPPREFSAAREFRCTNCGETWTGAAKGGCACGMRIGSKDAGVRCVPNPDRRPDLLSEIIAKETL